MEIRKVAEALLRNQTSSLPAFLTPSISRWATKSGRSLRPVQSRICQRYIASSVRCSMATPRPALTTTSTPSEAIDEEGRAGVAQSQSWAKAGMGGNRTNRSRLYDSRFENQTRLPSSNNSELIFNNGNSAADLLSAYNIQSMQRSGNININGMATPKPSLGNNVMNQVGDSMRMPPAPRVPMRLSPTTGRTVTIGAGVDIARGFRLLEQSCARNKVRKDFTAQRFHERGGLKRKRMKRVRWRLRFMTGFKTAVSRVKHLKAQGW